MQHHPGHEFIEQGLLDISQAKSTIYSALLFSAKSRLENLGIVLNGVSPIDPSMELYQSLYLQYGDAAHSKFNALNRRLISFMRSVEGELSNA